MGRQENGSYKVTQGHQGGNTGIWSPVSCSARQATLPWQGAQGSQTRFSMLGHACAHTLLQAHLQPVECTHTHTCPATTRGDKPWTCHLHGHCPSPCLQVSTHCPPKPPLCPVSPSPPAPCPQHPKAPCQPHRQHAMPGGSACGAAQFGGLRVRGCVPPFPTSRSPLHCLCCERGKQKQKKRQCQTHILNPGK